jgi:hypothetical protein
MNMTNTKDIASNGIAVAAVLAAVIVSMLLSETTALAQVADGPVPTYGGSANLPSLAKLFRADGDALNIRRSLATLDSMAAVASHGTNQVLIVRGSRSPVIRKLAGGILGALGGFFAGGFLGAKIEGDCACDDPGLRGFQIGAPVGAVAGGILGAWFF